MNLKKFEQKLKEKTTIDSVTGCWLYNGAPNNEGYCHLMVDNLREKVHRLSAAIYLDYNLLDCDKQINHKLNCPNKNCWNPEHLYIGTKWENTRDSILSGTFSPTTNQLKTHCPQGHEYTEENTYVNPKGSRICRLCRNEKQNERYRLYGRL